MCVLRVRFGQFIASNDLSEIWVKLRHCQERILLIYYSTRTVDNTYSLCICVWPDSTLSITDVTSS